MRLVFSLSLSRSVAFRSKRDQTFELMEKLVTQNIQKRILRVEQASDTTCVSHFSKRLCIGPKRDVSVDLLTVFFVPICGRRMIWIDLAAVLLPLHQKTDGNNDDDERLN